jgi:H/ACA ribonucleoprotein complex subunit 4
MRELRRVRTGPFTEEKLSTLHDLADACAAWTEKGDETLLRKLISPMEFGLSLLPKIYIRDSAVDAICHGANLAVPGIVKVETEIKSSDVVAVFTQKGEAVALAKALLSTEGILDLDHGLAAKTERVIMSPGVYPRMWRSRLKSPR